ncbi:sugar phosphate isomerase/epimerase family protein [Aestuariimicrobium ganziense]|uniref:sugar phosphate isomerase/epimerase family protein n=1 Tax=Aestuariimicrobium ganziense TaxID=2773677 RepID=UPI001F1F27D3|nr:sugar phosphate isomerase/epimerase [Aestuariimicrobium ganziense]
MAEWTPHGNPQTEPPGRCHLLDQSNLSVQLYTLRERLAEEPEAVLADLAEIGFKNVEPFGLTNFADVLAEGLPKHGLVAPTTHSMLGTLTGSREVEVDTNEVLDAAEKVGVKTIICPASSPELWQTRDGIAQVAEMLNKANALAAERGLEVGYHNHWWEIETPFDEGTGLDVLASLVDPAVRIEVDTYWASVGGTDVNALLGRLGDRVIALHLKDGDGSRDNKKQVAAGQGVIPIMDFVAAAPSMRYGVIELDDCSTDKTTAVRESFAYLNGK